MVSSQREIRFEDFVLDLDAVELRRGDSVVPVEPQVFDLICYMAGQSGRVVSRDDIIEHVWGGRIVSEGSISTRINAARKALNDDGKQQRLIKTVPRRGFKFVGEVEDATDQTEKSHEPAIAQESSDKSNIRQDIQFCTASDGVRIAFAEIGSGPVLVKGANWLNHLEYDWQSPVWRPFLRSLAERYRLIRYDPRGNGLSDWDVEDISFDAFVRDLESVIDATGLERFPLLGISQGCAVSIAYAIRNPTRVSHLILYGGVVQGRLKRGSAADVSQSEAMITLMGQGWGQENPAFRQIFTSLFLPGGSAEQIDWFNDLQRMTTSPENAARLRRTMDNIDISELLPQVNIPTLVMHCRDDAMQPFEQGRQLAAGIKGAKFVVLDGPNHMLLETDPGWRRFHDEIDAFLQV